MPSNQSPLGALPARFRRERLLLVGCGDVGMRVVRALGAPAPRLRVLALTSSPQRITELRAQGIVPLRGDLDDASTLMRLAGLATRVLHLAPPPGTGCADLRTVALARALARRRMPRALVYGSTSGVYGDCAGAWVAETRRSAPGSDRAWRRLHAEMQLRALGRRGIRVSLLRIPGIYAPDRPGGSPRERLRQATPTLRAQEDVYVSRIHADDLARACSAALWRGKSQRIYHVSDDDCLRMGEYFDLAADLYGLPHLPRITRDQAKETLSAAWLGFLSESRRLRNDRMRHELRVQLRYPTAREGLGAQCG